MVTKEKVKVLSQTQLATTREAREQFLNEVPLWLEKANLLPALDRYEFRLVLDEAITNAMEHGNLWDPKKFILVTISTWQDKLSITIKDQGFGFNVAHLSDSLPIPNKPSYRGRGIFIIKKFCDVSWNNIGNEITLTIPLRRE